MASPTTALTRALQYTVFAFDTLQRRRHGVFDLSQEPNCLLRISREQSKQPRKLSDGTLVNQGAEVIVIHLWNEHIPIMGPGGPDLPWAVRFYDAFRNSLRCLCQTIESDPAYAGVAAIRGESSFSSCVGWEKYGRFMRRLGFDFQVLPEGPALARASHFFVHMYVWAMVYALHPVGLRGRPVGSAERAEIWMSLGTLRKLYGEKARDREMAV